MGSRHPTETSSQPLPGASPSASSDASAGESGDHWSSIARQWQHVGPPLRPCAADLDVYATAVLQWTANHGVPRGLILGVTSELYHLPWPGGPEAMGVRAVDRCPNMIEALWPGPPGSALCADWTELPFASNSFDLVLCDGGLTVLEYPRQLLQFARRLRDILAPDGLAAFRLCVPPPQPESIQAVFADLHQGHIQDLSTLKVRLWMALHQQTEQGVRLADVWDVIHQEAGDLAALADKIGWTREHISAINTYRNCSGRYYFPSVAEVLATFTDTIRGFQSAGVHVPTYPLGECFPIVQLRRSP